MDSWLLIQLMYWAMLSFESGEKSRSETVSSKPWRASMMIAGVSSPTVSLSLAKESGKWTFSNLLILLSCSEEISSSKLSRSLMNGLTMMHLTSLIESRHLSAETQREPLLPPETKATTVGVATSCRGFNMFLNNLEMWIAECSKDVFNGNMNFSSANFSISSSWIGVARGTFILFLPPQVNVRRWEARLAAMESFLSKWVMLIDSVILSDSL